MGFVAGNEVRMVSLWTIGLWQCDMTNSYFGEMLHPYVP